MDEDIRPLMVTIRCTAFNHEPYIRQCLEGFVMQRTNFRFEAIVHDDASTDGTAAIIQEYAEKYPDIIKPIFETENQYSKHDGSLRRIMDEHTHGKYVAICEGDDYWINPLKLQMQVDYLEAHPKCLLVCNRAKLYSEKKQKYIGESYCYNDSQEVEVKDIILRGGLFISTCSIVCHHTFFTEKMPTYHSKCHVGDYPLQIMAAMKGQVYYINELLSVYRVDNINSWVSTHKKGSVEKLINGTKSEVIMLQGYSHEYPIYKKYYNDRIALYINNMKPENSSAKEISQYLNSFKEEIERYSLFWKFDIIIKRRRLKLFFRLWRKLWIKRYLPKCIYY